MKFTIGTTNQKQVKVDAMVLSDTRALICASSGLGKSWLLRLIAENVASSVQTVIIDPEGEFSTLREKLDVLIVSENGDLRADIRSAGLLARKLAETGVSAVIDIYDLPGKEDPWVKRRMFVAELLNELMNLPKKLYHPMIVMVDEAHQFAQEETTNDSYVINGTRVYPSLLSRSAIRSLMSAGRKRGIGGILATQRISKIDKDAIADARNVFIGGTTLDIDQRRAGDILGMSKSESVALRDLAPGTFFSFGPAIDGKGIVRFKSSDVQTTHPKAGQRSKIVVPKASTQIAGIVEQIGDLPAIAEEEVKTMDALKKENESLKREMKARPAQVQTEVKIERVEVPVLPPEQLDSIVKSLADMNAHARDIRAVADKIESYPLELVPIVGMLKNAVEKYSNGHLHSFTEGVKMHVGIDRGAPGKDKTVATVMHKDIKNPALLHVVSSVEITRAMQKILDAMVWMESVGLRQSKRVVVASLAGRSVKSSQWGGDLARLVENGLINYPGSDSVCLTQEGRALANASPAPLSTDQLQHAILLRLSKAQARILQVLIDKYPDAVNRDWLADQLGRSVKSSQWGGDLADLRDFGLIDYPSSTEAIALPVLFLE